MIAAFPDKAKFVLQFVDHNTQYMGFTEDVAKLTRRKKLKAQQDFPEKFVDIVGVTFLGLDTLLDHVKNKLIELSGTDLQSRGKAIGIQLRKN